MGFTKQEFDYAPYRAFYAFNREQLDEGRMGKPLEDLTSLGGGLYCPKDTADLLVVAMLAHHKSERDRRLAEVGLKNIILYELNNYECHYTGEVEDALETCMYYGATKEQVRGVFKNRNFVI